MDLTTKDGVRELMESSKSEVEWDDNCDKVKAANDGYPSFWFREIILTRVLERAQKRWSEL